jgi:hypothetical protein
MIERTLTPRIWNSTRVEWLVVVVVVEVIVVAKIENK